MVGGSEKGNPQRPEVRRKRKSTGMRDLDSLPAGLAVDPRGGCAGKTLPLLRGAAPLGSGIKST